MSLLWTARALRDATGGLAREPFDARGISIDSRTLRPGDLFVALVGHAGDGHAHVRAALAAGAAGAMVHALPDEVSDDAPLLQVADTAAGLSALGHFARGRTAARIAAVTGSVGKTTVKEMLRRILTESGKTFAAEASHNNHWGVPLTLGRVAADAAYGIVEIGMNHAGEIAPLARLARPHVALVTAVERVHVGHLGSIEAIAAEKASILTGLEPGGTAVLPADSRWLARLRAAAGTAHIVTFGRHASADARLITADGDADGVFITADVHGTRISVRLAAPGEHMACNAVAAIAAAVALGVEAPRAAAALGGFAPVAGRGAREPILGGTATLLDESYNASAVSVRAALAVLRAQDATRRLAVLGDMLELGDEGPAEHADLASDVTAAADLLFTCGPLMAGLRDAVADGRRGAHAADSVTLAPMVRAAVRAGDAVLVKGSAGSRMSAVVAALRAA